MQATRPDKLQRQETRFIELPRLHDGEKLVFRIRALPTHELVEKLGTVPGLTGGDETVSWEELRSRVLAAKEPMAALAVAAVVEPPLSSGTEPEEGKAWWWAVHPENQKFVLAEIQRFAGGNDEAAMRTATFPADSAREGGGGAAPAPGEVGGGPATSAVGAEAPTALGAAV